MSKVKETFGKVKAKAVEVKDKAVSKVCDFVVEHPYAAMGIAAGLIGGAGILGGKMLDGKTKELNDNPEHRRSLEGDDILPVEAYWTESGLKEHYDLVENLVRNLDMQNNELFVMEQYLDEQTNEEMRCCYHQFDSPTNPNKAYCIKHSWNANH